MFNFFCFFSNWENRSAGREPAEDCGGGMELHGPAGDECVIAPGQARRAYAAGTDCKVWRDFLLFFVEDSITLLRPHALPPCLGPGVNMMRSPLTGRNFEYMGEDPFLVAALGVPIIRAMQAHDMAACAKVDESTPGSLAHTASEIIKLLEITGANE
jgi:hypothetical protein